MPIIYNSDIMEEMKKKSQEEILEKVQKIISEYMNTPKEAIVWNADLSEDLNIASLDKVDILIRIEDEFDFSFQDEDISDFQTIGNIVEKLSR